MKNRYSICVFGILLFICAAIIIFSALELNDQKMEELPESQTILEEDLSVREAPAADETVTSSKQEDAYKYIILEEGGHLLVYYSDNATVFFDSGIEAVNLPAELTEELKTGIRFADEEELYEFLENYSS